MSTLFTAAASDAAKAMDAVARSLKGKPISPHTAAEGITTLMEAVDALHRAIDDLDQRARTITRSDDPTITKRVRDIAFSARDHLRTADLGVLKARDAGEEAGYALAELARAVRGSEFTF
jgi:hypothetical protein